MAKKEKVVDTNIDIMNVNPETLTKEQLVARYEANVARRKELAEENKLLIELHKNATSSAKKDKAEKQLEEARAKLAKLQAAAVEAGIIEVAPVTPVQA